MWTREEGRRGWLPYPLQPVAPFGSGVVASNIEEAGILSTDSKPKVVLHFGSGGAWPESTELAMSYTASTPL